MRILNGDLNKILNLDFKQGLQMWTSNGEFNGDFKW